MTVMSPRPFEGYDHDDRDRARSVTAGGVRSRFSDGEVAIMVSLIAAYVDLDTVSLLSRPVVQKCRDLALTVSQDVPEEDVIEVIAKARHWWNDGG